MSDMHFADALRGNSDGRSTLAFLARPYAVFLTVFLAIMVALSIDVAVVQSAAMKLRWPILGAAAIFGVMQVAAHGLRRFHPAAFFLGIVVLVAAMSAAWSMDPSYSIQRAASLALLYAATLLGVAAYARNEENVRTIFDLVWWLGAAVVLGGFLFRMGELGPGGRYVGLHDRATGAGTYAALFLPFAIYQVRFRFTGVGKVIGWVVVAAIFVQLALSGARMAMGTAVLVSLALWFAYYGRRAVLAIVVLAFLAPLPILLDQRKAERLEERSQKFLRVKTFSTFTGRLDRWKFGLEKFAEKPLAGFGFGISRTLAGLEEPWRFKLMPGEVFNLHSDQIEVMVDLGLVGYLPFACFWIALAVTGAAVLCRPPSNARHRAFAAFGAVVYAFGDTFMHGGFLSAGGGVAPFSWSMIAMFLSLAAMALETSPCGKTRTIEVSRRSTILRTCTDAQAVIRPGRATRPGFTRQELPSVRRILAGQSTQ